MVKGKVVDAKKASRWSASRSPSNLRAASGRKLTTKTDKRGEFIQLLTESGNVRITATDPKIGTASNETASSSARRRR